MSAKFDLSKLSSQERALYGLDDAPPANNEKPARIQASKKKSESSSRKNNKEKEGLAFWVNINDCVLWEKKQDRNTFDKNHVKELAKSMKGEQQIEPVIARIRNGKYQIFVGECRYDAAKINNEKLYILVRNVDDKTAFQWQLKENKDRAGQCDYTLGIYYQQLLNEKVYSSQKELAIELGFTEKKVSRFLSSTKLPKQLHENLDLRVISANTFSEIIRIWKKGKKYQSALLSCIDIINKGAGEKVIINRIESIINDSQKMSAPTFEIKASNSNQKLGRLVKKRKSLVIELSSKTIDSLSQGDLKKITNFLGKTLK